MTKILSKLNLSSKIFPLVFVLFFAATGSIYLAVTHAIVNSPILGVNNISCSAGITGWAYEPIDNPPYRLSVEVLVYETNGGQDNVLIANVKSDTANTSDFPSFRVSIPAANFNGTPHQYKVIAQGPGPGNNAGPGYGGTVYGADPQNLNCAAPTQPPPPPSPTPTPPTPTPTPTPAPTPSAPKSSGSTSSGSTKKVTVTPKVSTNTSNQTTPTSTDVQPATDGTGSLADTSNPSNVNANVPSNADSTVVSSDTLASVTFPKGTFDTDAYCSIDNGDSHNVPAKSAKVLGPYSIDCTDGSGNSLNDLKKSVAVNINLPAGKSNYSVYVSDTTWKKIPSSNSKNLLSFKLAKAELFAAAQPKGTNWGIIVLNIGGAFFLVLFIAGVIYFIHRRRQDEAAKYGGYNV
jgi:hypothetical protein